MYTVATVCDLIVAKAKLMAFLTVYQTKKCKCRCF